MITTYGSGEVLYQVFKAIALLLNGDGGILNTFIRTGAVIGGVYAALMALFKQEISWMVKWFAGTILLSQIILVPKTTVWINDPVLLRQYKIDNVPMGLAKIATTTSEISTVITELLEKALMQPDDLRFSQSGPMIFSKIMASSRVIQLTHPTARWNMMNFVSQCVVEPAWLGRKFTLDDVNNSINLWKLIETNASSARMVALKEIVPSGTPEPAAQICSCKDAVPKIKKMLEGAIQKETTRVGFEIFQNFFAQSKNESKNLGNRNADNLLKQYLPTSHKLLTEASQTAEEIMLQDLMIHAYRQAWEDKSVSLGNQSNIAIRKAYLQNRASLESAGVLAQQVLGSFRGIMEAIVYAMFIIIIPLCMLPAGFLIFMRWVKACIWLQLWPPLFSICNLIMTYAATAMSKSIIMNSCGISIATMPALADFNADMVAYAGWISYLYRYLHGEF